MACRLFGCKTLPVSKLTYCENEHFKQNINHFIQENAVENEIFNGSAIVGTMIVYDDIDWNETLAGWM